jgi:transposase
MTPREAELTSQLEQSREALAAAQREIAILRQKIDALARRIFGSSSERLDSKQMQLLLGVLQAEEATKPEHKVIPAKPAPAKEPKPRAPRLAAHLPVVEEVIDPEPVKADPTAWRCIGQEVSEQLDFEPGRFLRRRTVRRKYVHRTDLDQAPIIATLPERLLERSIPAPGLLTQIIVSRFCDHLPYYRQEQIYRSRHNVNLPRQTLVRWMELAAEWLKPIYDQIRTGVMAGGYVQVDETPIKYLEPGNGKTKQGYFWTCCSPGGDVIFQWETSRAASCLEAMIPVGFSGTIQCDAYPAYGAFVKTRDTIKLAGCWAHVRRKFFEAAPQAPVRMGWILGQIQHLYQIEARLRLMKAGPKLREAVRAHQSRPVVERIGRVLTRTKQSGRYLPQSDAGGAVDYALGQWPMFCLYLDNGRLEIDNNLVENAIRPTAIGKKNWLFVGEAEAGDRAAILYTLVECCRRRKIDPFTYLRDILTRLPTSTNHQIPQFTPAAWARAQTTARLEAAA